MAIEAGAVATATGAATGVETGTGTNASADDLLTATMREMAVGTDEARVVFVSTIIGGIAIATTGRGEIEAAGISIAMTAASLFGDRFSVKQIALDNSLVKRGGI